MFGAMHINLEAEGLPEVAILEEADLDTISQNQQLLITVVARTWSWRAFGE